MTRQSLHPHPPKRGRHRPPQRGLQALAAALGRLLKPVATVDWTAGPADAPFNGYPPPASAWERNAERRLGIIEKTLNNQNRLLLLTLVSVVADVVIGATK